MIERMIESMIDPEDISFELIPIRSSLLPNILDIENRAYSLGWTKKMFDDCLNSQYLCKAVSLKHKVTLKHRVIGYFIVQIILDEFHILNICIEPTLQRQGYGLHLLKLIKELATEQQINRILLEVRPSNKGAKKLYKRFGFVRNGLRKRYYPVDIKISPEREDAILMELMLF